MSTKPREQPDGWVTLYRGELKRLVCFDKQDPGREVKQKSTKKILATTVKLFSEPPYRILYTLYTENFANVI